MSEPQCFGSILVCALRVARLETNGAPDSGASSGYISNALIQADLGLEIEEGLDFTQKNGCGSILVALKQPDKIKRATLSFDLGLVDAELLSLLVGGDLFTSGGDTVGWQTPDYDDAEAQPVCIELWSQAQDGDVQATPTALSNAAAYFHWVLPKCQFVVENIPLRGEESTVLTVTGNGSSNPNITVNGPYNDWPSYIANAGGITKPLGFFLDDEMPTTDCGFTAVPAGS